MRMQWGTLLRLALLAVAGISGCGSDDSGSSVANPAPERPASISRPYVYEREVAAGAGFAARPGQIVVLDLEPSSGASRMVDNVSLHRLREGTHRFCIDQGDSYLRRLSVEDALGRSRLAVDRSIGCASIVLEDGVYALRTTHDATGISNAHRVAFVQSGNVSVSLLDGNGQPVGGWWAMRPDANADPLKRQGRVAAPPPVVNVGNTPTVQIVIADFANKQIDGNALFIFKPWQGSLDPTNNNVPRIFTNNTRLNVTYDVSPAFLAADLGGYSFINPINVFPLVVNDQGNNTGSLAQGFFGGDAASPFYLDPQFRFVWQSAYFPAPALFTVLFRFFPDGAIEPLRQGEVALFQQCNYGGKANVFAIDTSSFAELDSNVITLDKTTASVRLGNDTAVTLFPDTEFGGTPQVVKADTPCLDGTPIARGTRSIQVEPLTSVLTVSSRACVDCKLAGVDLTMNDLSGFNLAGADLSGATLTRTNLTLATNLTKTNFSGAKLFCTDFSGTDAAHRVDLTQALFGNAQYTTDYSCRMKLPWAVITPQALSPSVWRYFDLSDVVVQGLAAGPLSTQAQPLDLSRAMMTGANLAGAVLDYATGLAGADLTRVVLSGGSLMHVDLSRAVVVGTQLDGVTAQGATLTGVALQPANVQGITLDGATGFVGADLTGVVLTKAKLDGIDFTGAKFPMAHLEGAFLRGATLDRTTGLPAATLTGVDLTKASFTGASLARVSLQQATLDGATGLAGPNGSGVDLRAALFNNSSLKGVDLSNALLYGANFTNANLENATLAGAFLTNKLDDTPPIRDVGNFTGAHLKNVNLTGAKLSGAIFNNASFYSSANGVAPVFPCVADITQCKTTPVTGSTCSCATARGATMAATKFNGAYLFGVDFGGSSSTLDGATFTGAILVAANFSGAMFNIDGNSPPDFSSAYLQGTQLGGTNLSATSLSGSFLDFGSPLNPNAGNIIQILLGAAYTAFNGWEAPNQAVCVQAQYGPYTTVPTNVPTMTCPDGGSNPTTGCGMTDASNTAWASKTPIGGATPAGFYQFAPTYGSVNQSGSCNAGTYNLDW